MFERRSHWSAGEVSAGPDGDRSREGLCKASLAKEWLQRRRAGREPQRLKPDFKPGANTRLARGENCLYMSSYDLTAKTVGAYVKAFNRFRPALLNAYASSAALLASLIEHNGLKVHSPRTIVCASETLYPHQREVIEDVFKARVWDWYGLTELVGNASECERHNGY